MCILILTYLVTAGIFINIMPKVGNDPSTEPSGTLIL